MRREPIVCLWIFLTNGVFGVAAVEEVRKVEGESATLHSGVQEYERIIWLFGPQNKKIAQCWGGVSGNPWCEITDERLDRLKIDNQTGSLTIMSIRNEVAGSYTLQVFNNSKKVDKFFSVTVSAPLPIPIIVPEQSSSPKCVLLCSVMNVTEATLCWYKGNSLISSISVSDLNNSVSLPLEVNYQDNNNYSCVLNNSVSSQTKHLNITEFCPPHPEAGLHAGITALICVLVIAAAAAAGAAGAAAALFYHCCKKHKQTRRKGDFYKYVKNGETDSSHSDEESPSGNNE